MMITKEQRKAALAERPPRSASFSKKTREVGAERAFTDDAAEDRHRVEADLHHGEVVAGLFLHAQHVLGPGVAVVGHLAQAQAARGGQGDFGE